MQRHKKVILDDFYDEESIIPMYGIIYNQCVG